MLAFFFFFSWILWNSTYKEVRICILIKLALFFWLLCEFYLWIGAGWILFEVRRNSTVGPDVIFCSVIVISFLLIFMYGGAFIPSWEIWTVSRRHGCKMPAVLWCWWLGQHFQMIMLAEERIISSKICIPKDDYIEHKWGLNQDLTSWRWACASICK